MENLTEIINQMTTILNSCGPIIGFLLIIFESIFPIIPLVAIIGLNMLAFGDIPGLLISYLATICGCIGSFCLFKYVLKDKFKKIFKPKTQEKINDWMKKLNNVSFSTLATIIAFPPTPAFFVNIAAGLCGYDTRKYLMALIIGKPSMLIFYGYIAVSFVDSLKDPTKFLYVILLVFGVYIFSKIIGRVGKLEK